MHDRLELGEQDEDFSDLEDERDGLLARADPYGGCASHASGAPLFGSRPLAAKSERVVNKEIAIKSEGVFEQGTTKDGSRSKKEWPGKAMLGLKSEMPVEECSKRRSSRLTEEHSGGETPILKYEENDEDHSPWTEECRDTEVPILKSHKFEEESAEDQSWWTEEVWEEDWGSNGWHDHSWWGDDEGGRWETDAAAADFDAGESEVDEFDTPSKPSAAVPNATSATDARLEGSIKPGSSTAPMPPAKRQGQRFATARPKSVDLEILRAHMSYSDLDTNVAPPTRAPTRSCFSSLTKFAAPAPPPAPPPPAIGAPHTEIVKVLDSDSEDSDGAKLPMQLPRPPPPPARYVQREQPRQLPLPPPPPPRQVLRQPLMLPPQPPPRQPVPAPAPAGRPERPKAASVAALKPAPCLIAPLSHPPPTLHQILEHLKPSPNFHSAASDATRELQEIAQAAFGADTVVRPFGSLLQGACLKGSDIDLLVDVPAESMQAFECGGDGRPEVQALRRLMVKLPKRFFVKETTILLEHPGSDPYP